MALFRGSGAKFVSEPWICLFMAAVWFFLTSGWSLWLLAETRPLHHADYPYEEAQADGQVLVNGFNYMMPALLGNLKTYGGTGFVRGLRKRLDRLAEQGSLKLKGEDADSDLLEIDAEKMEDFDSLVSPLAQMISTAIAEGRLVAGAKGLSGLLIGIHKHLPWEERDMVPTHLLQDPRWAALLSQKRGFAKEDRVKLLRETFLFHQFDYEELERISSIVRGRSYHGGEAVIEQDSKGDEAYIIQKGQVEVKVEDQIGETHTVAVLSPGDFFGELALLEDAPRSATIVAMDELEVLVLDRPVFEKFVQKHGGAKEKLSEAIRALRVIQRMPLFEEFSSGEMATVASKFNMEIYREGQKIVIQGEMGDRFYVIQSGMAEVIIGTNGEEEKIRSLRPGEFFGELALLQDIPRTATVRAQESTTVFSLRKSDFIELFGGHPFALKKLQRESSRRKEIAAKHTH